MLSPRITFAVVVGVLICVASAAGEGEAPKKNKLKECNAEVERLTAEVAGLKSALLEAVPALQECQAALAKELSGAWSLGVMLQLAEHAMETVFALAVKCGEAGWDAVSPHWAAHGAPVVAGARTAVTGACADVSAAWSTYAGPHVAAVAPLTKDALDTAWKAHAAGTLILAGALARYVGPLHARMAAEGVIVGLAGLLALWVATAVLGGALSCARWCCARKGKGGKRGKRVNPPPTKPAAAAAEPAAPAMSKKQKAALEQEELKESKKRTGFGYKPT